MAGKELEMKRPAKLLVHLEVRRVCFRRHASRSSNVVWFKKVVLSATRKLNKAAAVATPGRQQNAHA